MSARKAEAIGHADFLADLAALLLGSLTAEDADDVRAHVDQCRICADAERELTEAITALGSLPPEALIDGPPDNAELLVQRTLHRLRSAGD